MNDMHIHSYIILSTHFFHCTGIPNIPSSRESTPLSMASEFINAYRLQEEYVNLETFLSNQIVRRLHLGMKFNPLALDMQEGYGDHSFPQEGYGDHSFPQERYGDHSFPQEGSFLYSDHSFPQEGSFLYSDQPFPQEGSFLYSDHSFPQEGSFLYSDHSFPQERYGDHPFPYHNYIFQVNLAIMYTIIH